MGITVIKLTVSNPSDSKISEETSSLIDSGSTHSFVNSGILKRLGIKPNDKRDFVLANGELITRKLGTWTQSNSKIEI